MQSQVGLRKHHYKQSQWRWWHSSWAISEPKRWCCESAALKVPANLESSAVMTGLGKVSVHSNPKERQCQRMLQPPHNCTDLTRCKFSSVHFSHSVLSDSLRPHELQHARPPCPAPTPGVHSNSRPSSRWCHPAISSSFVPFSSCPQSLPASESFPMSQLFAWGGQSTGVSALASFLPKKSQGWSRLEWTGWISWQSKGLSRVFSNTTVQKHQFFSTQLSL